MSRSTVDNLKYEIFEGELLNPMRGHELSDLERHIGNFLLGGGSEKPIGIKEIIDSVHLYLNKKISARAVKRIIRSLRKTHCFPILSRKINEPGKKKTTGYWWSASSDEMKEFIPQFKKQPMDELHTLSRMVKTNYPELAGQLRFDLEADYE